MIIDDFADIRRRMLGELKAQPVPPAPPEKPKEPPCGYCRGTGWHYDKNGMNMICLGCGNPEGFPKP